MRSPTVTTKLQRLAEQANHNPERVFTNLAHLIDVDFLREAYRRTSKSSAAGIDGVTAKLYAEHLDDNLHDLHDRLRRGRYQAAPVVRVWIEKEDGGQRPIGKPAFEEKIVQRAVAMLLEAIYEQDFSDSSYGFRPGRSPHQALHALRTHCMEEGIGWIVDADVSGYFDSIDRTRLREVLRRRVNDGRIMRLIGKWLRAGVMEEGVLHHPETGVVQGGVISPVLANIFLHHVLDEWFEREVQPRLKGRSFLTRFADDWIMGCELETDAQRLMAVLPKRFGRFGLSLHPEKTVLIRFRKPTTRKGSGDGNGTFDFLGLTHYWTRSRRGYWVIHRRTARKRLRRTKKALWRWCRANRHLPLKDQYWKLCQKLRGHFQYYGIRGNYRLLSKVRRHAEKAWRYWLSRRSHKSAISWEKFQKLKAVFGLPIPKIVHQI
ncbi:MAG TPA: group II intron reverse transcriptase/maturase [Gammaproteobacteria bacterium]|nr:group II intron reverse transcriptase/maturase [Gammaproteobacteria bacterium]